MRPKLALPVLLLLTWSLAACGNGSGDATATDPGSEPSATNPSPTAVPAAPGRVRTRNLVTVMDTGTPELCLGAVAESYPPQCSGPKLVGWDWADHDGTYEKSGTTRWGVYVVTGTWDGTSFTFEDAVPGAVYDPMPEDPVPLPDPGTDYTADELAAIAEDLGRALPGVQSAYNDEKGHVLVDVVYDDVTLQDRVDAEYGAHVVVVSSQLVDA